MYIIGWVVGNVLYTAAIAAIVAGILDSKREEKMIGIAKKMIRAEKEC